jgi:hypothetical protein
MSRPALAILFLACAAAPAAADEAPSPADVQFFESKVRPLLAERCQNCHSVKAKKQRGGLLLDSRAAMLKGGDTGPAVVPGHPDKSLLIKAVRHADPELTMPPTGKLPAPALAVLEEWVRRGAPYPGPAAVAAGHTVNIAEGRKFWSFQPLRQAAPPAVRDGAWPRGRIDRFLLAEMEKRGLGPSPVADRRVLVRRIYFDLVGLPPTLAEVDAFVNDPRPDAYERLVERLLATPQHGERWARFWLDLARYCDEPEPWSDCKGSPHLYRDWVVKALADDVPYDRFVQLQLAADLMPDSRPADRAALGFLGLSPTYWKELNLDKDVIRGVVAEEWEERIHTIGSTFLGLTVACARCHDHKYDPVTTQDYYALAGVLASSRLADRPLLPNAEARAVLAARERVKALEAEVKKRNSDKNKEGHEKAKALSQEIERLRRETPHYDAPMAPAVEEAALYVLPDGAHRTKLEYRPGVAQDVAMQVRGSPTNLGPVVPRRFLAVLSPDSPRPFTQGSGRLELARALVTDAAPLTARVIVNRVWRHHFGTGLVETPSDFGAQGDRPSHPQLLDDLAARFVANGWSLRWLHREIVLSAAYRQASTTDARKQAVEPDNRLLWRMNRRRLEVEAWRDAMLAASGTLSLDVGGPAQELGDPKNRRRTLYGKVKRRELSDVLRLHDFPDPTTHSGNRVPTTTPLQQLFTLNSPFLQEQASALVKRLHAEAPANDEVRVRHAYRLLYGREATAGQVRLALDFLGAGDRAALWDQYAQALLASNEFLFVD